jgi:hypothetical protein
MPVIGIPNSQDIPRLIFSAPYFEQVPLAEMIAPTVTEATEALLPSLLPPFIDGAANAAVAQLAVLLTGSSMSGPLFLSPTMPSMPAQAASMAYVDAMMATAGVPEVPLVPIGQSWAREVGQWVPIGLTGASLPLAGGTMQGAINMSGNLITNLGPVPVMPNGAAPAQWVLQQISSLNLYQGTWNADTNTPNLTLSGAQQNNYTWVATTASPSGILVTYPIPGVQGLTVFNGDTLTYSTVDGAFNVIHNAGLTLDEIEGLFLALAGGTMQGPLLLSSVPTSAMQAAPMQWVQQQVAAAPYLPLVGGTLSGPLNIAGINENIDPGSPWAAIAYGITTSGGGGGSGGLAFRQLRGGFAAPAPMQTGDFLGGFGCLAQVNNLLGNMAYAGGIVLVATENYTSNTFGAQWQFSAVPRGNDTEILLGAWDTDVLDVRTNLTVTGAISVQGDIATAGNYQTPLGVSYKTRPPVGIYFDTVPDYFFSEINGVSGYNLVHSNADTNTWAVGGLFYLSAGSGMMNGFFGEATWPIDFSDRKLKRNLQPPSKDALATLRDITVYQGDCKPGGPDAVETHWDWTLVADELADIMPRAYVPPREFKGGETYAQISTYPIVAALVRAVQQLDERMTRAEGHRRAR